MELNQALEKLVNKERNLIDKIDMEVDEERELRFASQLVEVRAQIQKLLPKRA